MVARRAAVQREVTAPSMGPDAIELIREDQIKTEMERRAAYWLHKKGLSADYMTDRKAS